MVFLTPFLYPSICRAVSVYVSFISIHLFSTVLRSFFSACFHLLHSCVLNRSLIASSFSPSIQNILYIISFCVYFILILIPAITSMRSDAMSGPVNVRHFVTTLFHLLFTMMKSIMSFVFPSGDSHVHFLFAFLW